MTDSIKVVVVSPDAVLFDETCSQLKVPGLTQELAILPDHTPLYAQLSQGQLELISVNHQKTTIPIEGGMIRVKRNQVSILVGFETRETLFKV